MILDQIYDELSCKQAKFPRILSQNSQNDLEGQCQWPLFSIPTENIPWCMFGANLVIPAQICDELSYRQSKFHGQTDGQTKATTIPLRPEGINNPLVYFQLKTNSVGITEISVGPMANNMYFIQWIITSYYPNGYELYRNNSVCIKISCISYCSYILSTFNWCCKIQLDMTTARQHLKSPRSLSGTSTHPHTWLPPS